jgi:hypothetical protein
MVWICGVADFLGRFSRYDRGIPRRAEGCLAMAPSVVARIMI